MDELAGRPTNIKRGTKTLNAALGLLGDIRATGEQLVSLGRVYALLMETHRRLHPTLKTVKPEALR
jgi:hypothetical protein